MTWTGPEGAQSLSSGGIVVVRCTAVCLHSQCSWNSLPKCDLICVDVVDLLKLFILLVDDLECIYDDTGLDIYSRPHHKVPIRFSTSDGTLISITSITILCICT